MRSRGCDGNCRLGAELARASAGASHAPAVTVAHRCKKRLRVSRNKFASLARLLSGFLGSWHAGEGARATPACHRLLLRFHERDS